jgi:hypothetical protein
MMNRLWPKERRRGGRGATGAEGKADDKHGLALREEVDVQQDEDVRVVAEVEQEVVVLLASVIRHKNEKQCFSRAWGSLAGKKQEGCDQTAGEAGLIRT